MTRQALACIGASLLRQPSDLSEHGADLAPYRGMNFLAEASSPSPTHHRCNQRTEPSDLMALAFGKLLSTEPKSISWKGNGRTRKELAAGPRGHHVTHWCLPAQEASSCRVLHACAKWSTGGFCCPKGGAEWPCLQRAGSIADLAFLNFGPPPFLTTIQI